ncbi:MAG: 4Fe-4S dicluster domain-containing protein [Deltaproteobacteria bacterium]|nr:4Fe-4S dicluster domain-containing protein [Deltaproteobacteria bacterium]
MSVKKKRGRRHCPPRRDMDRREFLADAAKMGAAIAAAGALSSCGKTLQLHKHFAELSPEEVKVVLEKLENEYRQDTGRDVSISAEPAMEGVFFGYALDLSRCVGCRKCVYACVEENNLSVDPQMHWITVHEMDKAGGVDLSHSDRYYDHPVVPDPGHFYMPISCQQCRNPPCTKVCPTQATWQEPDGITVIDYDWCIGCRYCMAACPYGARHFNWGEPQPDEESFNSETHYLGNRPRPKGVVEKCTFCIQRVRKGKYPACVEVCPVGARKFGNLLDPESEVRYVIENKRVYLLKEELNTRPKFFYFYGT